MTGGHPRRRRAAAESEASGSNFRGPTRAYSFCMDGHYFEGAYCPLDGWSSPASRELAAAVEQLTRGRRRVSMAELRIAGVSAVTLCKTVIIEFGSETSFGAFAPISE